MLISYHAWYSYGAPLSINTRKNVIIVDFVQIVELQWNIGQIEFLAIKVLNIRTSPSFLLTDEENDISNIYVL